MGPTVVLHDDTRPFDMRTILETAARERVSTMTFVGDAYARPMVDELRRTEYDLSALGVVGTGGAPTSPEMKRALMELLPHVTIRAGYGASEIGAMTSGVASPGAARTQRFPLGPTARLLSTDRTRSVEPGEDEIGWMAKCDHVPLGYLDDPAAAEATFPVIDGVRVAVPGDRARFTPDGQVELLGREAPRAFAFVDRVQRHPSGTADYGWARPTSARAVEVR